MINHSQARRELNIKLKTLLKSKTGYKLVDNPIDPPFLYSHTIVPLFDREVLEIAMGNKSSELEKHFIIHTDRGEVRYGPGTILAEAPGEEEVCRHNILAAFTELQDSEELKMVTKTHGDIKEAIPNLKNAAEEFDLLGVIPGRCRICRRIGI